MFTNDLPLVCLVGGNGDDPFSLRNHRKGSRVGKDVFAETLASNFGFKHLKFAGKLRHNTRINYGSDVHHIIGHKEVEQLTLGETLMPNQLKRLISFTDSMRNEWVHTNGPCTLEKLTTDSIGNDLIMNSARFDRNQNPMVFVEAMAKEICNTDPDSPVVISDLRQYNEWAFVRSAGAIIIEVVRRSAEARPIDGQLNANCDLRWYNNGTEDAFAASIIDVFGAYRSGWHPDLLRAANHTGWGAQSQARTSTFDPESEVGVDWGFGSTLSHTAKRNLAAEGVLSLGSFIKQ